ncbi:jg9693 [Pararge aegeria aegeria]|uniref:Jg9693 protein n=1 Tax=Pararge aegeria aegeria TaxID=348720 RepID=A0A8S4RTJ7_9NEOP|nr:jg9693 [Pararge aegeria aegeria]
MKVQQTDSLVANKVKSTKTSFVVQPYFTCTSRLIGYTTPGFEGHYNSHTLVLVPSRFVNRLRMMNDKIKFYSLNVPHVFKSGSSVFIQRSFATASCSRSMLPHSGTASLEKELGTRQPL